MRAARSIGLDERHPPRDIRAGGGRRLASRRQEERIAIEPLTSRRGPPPEQPHEEFTLPAADLQDVIAGRDLTPVDERVQPFR